MKGLVINNVKKFLTKLDLSIKKKKKLKRIYIIDYQLFEFKKNLELYKRYNPEF